MTEIAVQAPAAGLGGGRPIVYGGLVALLACAVAIALVAGRFPIDVPTALSILAAQILPIEPGWTEVQERIVTLVRAPRVFLAGLCGAGLALCGAALQGVFRNPLVAPDILGVSSGAAFGGAVSILLGAAGLTLIGSAFASGVLALLLVGWIARVDGRTEPMTVVLAGIVVGAMFMALVSLVQFLADPNSSLPAIVFWLMGSFTVATWQRFAFAAPVLAGGAALLLLMRFRINVLSLGDEEARALGVPVERDRWIVFLVVALIVGASVSVAGVVGWVGLVIPHAARMLIGPDHRHLLPASALLGAGYLVLIDTVARSATAAEIPLGVLTALIGAPVFALLLRRAQRQRAEP